MTTMTRIHLVGSATSPDGPILSEPMLPFGAGGGLRRHACTDEARRPEDCDVVLPQSVYGTILGHLGQDPKNELGGLLLGYELFARDGRRSTVFIAQALPAPHTEGSAVRLTFPPETWAAFDESTEELRRLGLPLQRVGWYHSHPGHGLFLSKWDLDVCKDFPRPTHLALVVDPIRDEGGFFVHGRDGFRTQSPQGFWELCDRQAASLVTWKNVREIESSAAPAPQPGKPEKPHRSFALAFALGTALLAALASWGTYAAMSSRHEMAWHDLERRLEDQQEQMQEQMKEQRGRLDDAVAAVARAERSAAEAERARKELVEARATERAAWRSRLDGISRVVEQLKADLAEGK